MQANAGNGLRSVLIITFILLILIPPLVFISVALVSGLSYIETFEALLGQYRSERVNLAVCTAIGLFPWILLLIVFGVRRLLKRPSTNQYLYAIGGAAPAILAALYANFEYWPTFLPQRAYAGFPHGLEFVIGSGVFAPIGMLIGFAIVWLVARGRD